MMVFHILTAILVILKVLGLISISWWGALAPSIVAVTLTLVVIFGLGGLWGWLALGNIREK